MIQSMEYCAQINKTIRMIPAKISQIRSKWKKASVGTIKTKYEKVNNICCAVAIFFMILVIMVNLTFVVQIYFVKEEFPDVFGVFPLIPLNDGGAPFVENGDFVLCQKIDDNSISRLQEGDIVTHFSDSSHTKLVMCQVVSVDGNTATLLPPNSTKLYELSADEIVGAIRFSIPILGFIIYFLSTLPGFLICVVIPVFVLTEIYLYLRRKAAQKANDEESMLLAELEWQKAERERLLALLNQKPQKRTLLHILGASIAALCVTVPVATLFGLHLKDKKDAEKERRRIEDRRDRLAESIGKLILFAGNAFQSRRSKKRRKKNR